MGVPVIDANCQRASEMQYESRAVSLFALRARATRGSRLCRSPLENLARSRSLFSLRSAQILEQKRDCSQSNNKPEWLDVLKLVSRTRINYDDDTIVYCVSSCWKFANLLNIVWFQKISIPPHGRLLEIPRGGGGSKAEISEGSGGFIGSSFSRG